MRGKTPTGTARAGKGRRGKAPRIDFIPRQVPQCRSKLSATAPPGCRVDYLPLADDEYLSANWSLDAPEPPKLGCGLPRAVFVGAGQYRCQRQGHAVRTQLLNNVSLLLQKHKIPHVLSYGTLLGAYRHGMLAWWDDDADLVVQEEDVERILELSPQAVQYSFKFKRSHSNRPKHYKLATSYLYPRSPEEGTLLYLSAITLLHPDITTPRGCRRHNLLKSKKGIYVDMFVMSPIKFPLDTGLFTFGHDELYSYADIFPVKECWLGGYCFFCPHRTRVVLTRMYKNLSLIHEFNSSACELQLKERGSLFSSKWRSERLSGESFPDMPLLREGPDSTLVVSIPEVYEEELREARKTAEAHKTPDDRAGCDWHFVEDLGAFRKNQSNSDCMPQRRQERQGRQG